MASAAVMGSFSDLSGVKKEAIHNNEVDRLLAKLDLSGKEKVEFVLHIRLVARRHPSATGGRFYPCSRLCHLPFPFT